MPIGWFFAQYVRRGTGSPPKRYCAMDDFTAQINTDGGRWAEAECLGGEAIVKVRASVATLTAIAADPRFDRVPPGVRLDDTLASLTPAQRTGLRDKLESLGYPTGEIQERLGADLADKTLRDVLQFACRRRRVPRYDEATDTIVLDGSVHGCRQPENVNREVSDD